MSDRMRKLLLGDWGIPLLRDPIDLLRLSFLAGAVVVLFTGSLGEAIRLLLTMFAVFVPRLLQLPRPFDLAFVLGMSLQGWGNVFELFSEVDWYDLLVHAVLTGLSAPAAYLALARAEVLPDPAHETRAHQHLGVWLVCFSLGLAIEAIYEMYEWTADELLGTNLSKSLEDTIVDMFVSALGAAAGALLLLAWFVYGWGSVRRVPGDRVHGRSDRTASGA